MSLSQFFSSLRMMLVDSLNHNSEYLSLPSSFLCTRIFGFCNTFIAFYVAASAFYNSLPSLTHKDTDTSTKVVISLFFATVLMSFLPEAFMLA